MRKKRIIKMILKISLCVFVGLVVIASIFLVNPVRTIYSIKKANGLYTMTYYGNYDWFLKKVDDKYFIKPDSKNINGCSLFSAFGNRDHPIFARNNDNYDVPVLITRCNPSDGYSSIAVSRINILGFFKNLSPELPPLGDRIKFLAAPDLVFDGMNECGVAVGGATILDTHPRVNIDKNKETVSLCYVLRHILDHAKNVDEAIKIAKNYNIIDENKVLRAHVLIADPSGHSAILEYFDGEIQTIRNKEPWQVLTNFQICGKDLKNGSPCDRYNSASQQLKKSKGNVTWQSGMDILKGLEMTSPAIPRQWSTIYDMKSLTIYFALYGDYNNIKKFSLKP